MPTDQWKSDVEYIMAGGSLAEATRRLDALDRARADIPALLDHIDAQAAALADLRARVAALTEALTGLLLSYEGYVKAKDDYGRDWEALPAVATARAALPPPPVADAREE